MSHWMPSATLVFPWPANPALGALWPLQLFGDKQPVMAQITRSQVARGGMVTVTTWWHRVTTLSQASSKSSCSFWLTSRCTLSMKLAWTPQALQTDLHPIATIQPMQPCLLLPFAALPHSVQVWIWQCQIAPPACFGPECLAGSVWRLFLRTTKIYIWMPASSTPVGWG